MSVLDRQAWHVVDWTTCRPPRLSRPLSGAELKYVHAQFLDSARIDVATTVGVFVFVVGAVGMFRGKDVIQQTAERIGRGLPLVLVGMLGFVGYVATVVIRQRVTERELLRGAIDHYAAGEQQR